MCYPGSVMVVQSGSCEVGDRACARNGERCRRAHDERLDKKPSTSANCAGGYVTVSLGANPPYGRCDAPGKCPLRPFWGPLPCPRQLAITATGGNSIVDVWPHSWTPKCSRSLHAVFESLNAIVPSLPTDQGRRSRIKRGASPGEERDHGGDEPVTGICGRCSSPGHEYRSSPSRPQTSVTRSSSTVNRAS